MIWCRPSQIPSFSKLLLHCPGDRQMKVPRSSQSLPGVEGLIWDAQRGPSCSAASSTPGTWTSQHVTDVYTWGIWREWVTAEGFPQYWASTSIYRECGVEADWSGVQLSTQPPGASHEWRLCPCGYALLTQCRWARLNLSYSFSWGQCLEPEVHNIQSLSSLKPNWLMPSFLRWFLWVFSRVLFKGTLLIEWFNLVYKTRKYEACPGHLLFQESTEIDFKSLWLRLPL